MTPTTLDSFRRRETDAVRELYREYGRMVYAVAHHVLGRRDLAEDAVQQTFVRAWQAADRIDIDRDPAPWLATIAKHVAIDIARYEARRRVSPLADVDRHDGVTVSVPPDLGVVDSVWRVRRAIDALPPELTDIVRMQHLNGMTHGEIAEKLGVPLGTVKSRSHRAHRMLASELRSLR